MNKEHNAQEGWRPFGRHRRSRKRHRATWRVSCDLPSGSDQREGEEQYLLELFEGIEACKDAGIPCEEVERAILSGLHQGYDQNDDPPDKARVAQDEEGIRVAIALCYDLGDITYRN